MDLQFEELCRETMEFCKSVGICYNIESSESGEYYIKLFLSLDNCKTMSDLEVQIANAIAEKHSYVKFVSLSNRFCFKWKLSYAVY